MSIGDPSLDLWCHPRTLPKDVRVWVREWARAAHAREETQAWTTPWPPSPRRLPVDNSKVDHDTPTHGPVGSGANVEVPHGIWTAVYKSPSGQLRGARCEIDGACRCSRPREVSIDVRQEPRLLKFLHASKPSCRCCSTSKRQPTSERIATTKPGLRAVEGAISSGSVARIVALLFGGGSSMVSVGSSSP